MPLNANTSFILEGRVNAPVLVLASSLAADPEMWALQLKAFSEHFCILRYGYRGHGGTPSLGTEASIEDLRQDLLALLDRLNIRQFSFMGLSLGAMLGMYLAAKNPERVRALVAANFRPFQIEATKEQWSQRIEAVRDRGIDAILGGTADRWLSQGFRNANPEIYQQVCRMIQRTSADGFSACAKAVQDYDARPFLKDIQCPVLLVAGSEDLAAPLSEYSLMQSSIKKSEYLLLNAAHISNIECASEFTSASLKFLKQVNN